MERRLSAILAADVVGYSALMERDGAGTFDRLRTIRVKLLEPEIAAHRGRIFKLMGDGLLIEFGSVLDAVECAVALQRGMAIASRDFHEGDRFEMRIGVSLGEVIVEGEDLYGDEVNVAARLQELAEPGGICISNKVANEVRKRLDLGLQSLGEKRLKNISEPIGAYYIDFEHPAGKPARLGTSNISNKPSVAILPFTSFGFDDDYFPDGLVDDIITALSKNSALCVVAKHSSFAYKGKATDIRQVARDLGVGYVLEGSIRKADGRYRITGQLLSGVSGVHIWAEKFEGGLTDIFDLQDRLTDSIVGAIIPSVQRAEIERARLKRPESLDAYDFYLRALPHAFANTPRDTDQAITHLAEAVRLDPDYAVVHAYLAWCYEQRFLRGGYHPPDRECALWHANLALDQGRDDPQVLSIAGFVYSTITHDNDTAMRALERALELNPDSAIANNFGAMVAMFCEHFDRSCQYACRALELSPLDPLNYHAHLALSWVCFFRREYKQAIHWSETALRSNPAFTILHATMIASQVNADHLQSALTSAKRLLDVAPTWTISGFTQMRVVRSELMDQFAFALRQVNLPE
ncbi:hypothetical protein ATY81_03630 [Rhizobium sp. R72]|uniref:adenylate/guanylate cyclase domain-containing protein n=1 Tax=unclassified Rhizobium TaxID=2613769 RepID=UPI000B533B51|nr:MULTISPECIES: adenylate/guanylate cyclase domain-containing protein [unclassified Rhizobium]OWW05061.1 hypothetical protein ATY81_03630 [Rhizobium sp. R72]OWW06118.1 hypothetical protein ATY80_03630 [Rhizobium sp. R711]